MDEQKLLDNLRKQKRGALEKAIKQYTPYVSVVVYNIIGQLMAQEDVEEVVSSVFISLWQHSAELDDSKGNIRTYLGTMARNSAKNKLRELKPHLPLEEYAAAASDEPYLVIEQQEQNSTVWNMIQELGEPDSEIFLRYYYYEEKVRNIAECTGLPASTVKTKLARGRQKLKEIIERDECL
ncbi:MAG TPA: sigma-70 family RNA polymerase sigma factor [Syntrophomonas sp.]|nr:sigma-70 family RNA polymerase sigma factor [Syntrophomonas sp.]